MSKGKVFLVALFSWLVGIGVGLLIALFVGNRSLVHSLQEENRLLHELNDTLSERRQEAGKPSGE